MKSCGYNKCFQFGDISNNQSKNQTPCVCPPIDSSLDVSSLLSYSCYGVHSVIIDKNGRAYGIGYNEDFRISKTLPKERFKTEHEIFIKDPSNHPAKFLSAVCGWSYTLYLVSLQRERKEKLVIASSNKAPFFLSINGLTSVKLFGGRTTAAAVDASGSIFIISESVLKTESVEASFLPDEETANFVVCLEKSIIVLSLSGCVYESVSDFKAAGKTEFVKIRELEGKKIVEISGSFEHCFAVCEDGTVFARGLNDHGQLGIDRREADEFTEISSLKKYKITSASAGGWHSLFLTSDGKVLACGYNRYGQLLLNNPSEKNIDSPIETTITTGATFIYAGGNMSTVFVNTNPPPNSPNMLINKSTKKDAGNSKLSKKILADSNSSDLITKLRQEILDLKEENSTMKEENTNLKKEISDLKDKNSTMKNENTNLKKEISRHQKEKQDFRILDYDTLHSLRVIRDINYGGSGKVVEVIREKRYAMKVMNISDTNFDNQQKFINEYESLITLNHPNIVRAYGIYLSDETTPLTILLELCKHDISKAIKECIFFES